LKYQTLAFYNIENLFDIYDDELTNDNDFLPTSDKRWTKKRYERKIYKIGSVISKIGFDNFNQPPAIIGLAEVENKMVLDDLIQCPDLVAYNYGIVHYDSNDERGIDVGLLYNKDEFTVESSEIFSVYIENEVGKRDYTRDILLVSGNLDGDNIHVIVNHWPSRRDGEQATSFKRILAAKKVLEIIAKLELIYDQPKIIIMGDFNDNPDNDSIVYLLKNDSLFNPMKELWTEDRGSQNHNFKWNLFDQIICNRNLKESIPNTYHFEKADIFDEKYLTQFNGKFQGHPYRTYVGKKYMGGFSDHFPVYILLKKHINE
jgi:predicted extracellular nuclease